MCLITEQKRVKILKQDLVVYKLMRHNEGKIFAWMINFEYVLNILYTEEISKRGCNEDSCAHDGIASGRYQYVNGEYSPSLTEIINGFHFAINKERLDSMFNSSHYKLYECVVPKGSRVYFDKTGLGVSNQIIIKKQVS